MRNLTVVIVMFLLLAGMVVVFKDVAINTVPIGSFLLAVVLTGGLLISILALVLGWAWRKFRG